MADVSAMRPSPIQSREPAKLFRSLFSDIDLERRVTVLEIGSALPETIDFFANFKCRLYFADLFGASVIQEQHEDDIAEELEDRFRGLLSFPEDARIDICLFWDFLNYLDVPALHAFCAALHPFIHQSTRAHGFGLLSIDTTLKNQQYGVEGLDVLSVRPRRTPQPRFFPRRQVDLSEQLPSFDFERGLLLPDGKLEFLLRSNVQAKQAGKRRLSYR